MCSQPASAAFSALAPHAVLVGSPGSTAYCHIACFDFVVPLRLLLLLLLA
jgi:hypothetical protein